MTRASGAAAAPSEAQVARRAATDRGETYFHPNLIPTHKRLPIAFTHGQGVWLYDEKGRKYIDLLAGIAVDSLGHAHPRLAGAIADQAHKLIHVSNNFHIAIQERLAEQLARLSRMDKVFFANSGAEANEAAIKLARLHGHRKGIDRPRIVVMEKAFHGRTLATLWAGGNTKIQAGFGPPVDGFVRVPLGDVAAIERALAEDPGIVAVLLEVVQGEGGVNLLAPRVMKEIEALCAANGLLLMLDEVQTGIGRTGRFLAFQHADVAPDVVTLAKGLGGGVPIGACLVAAKAVDLFGVGAHGSTFGGNPLACAAATAVLDVIEEDDLCGNARVVGQYMAERLRERLAGPGVAEVRGLGLLIGIELEQPCPDLMRHALDAGVVLSVTADKVVRLVPPLTITRDEADYAMDRLVPVIKSAARTS
ncbi:aspartate aminotransferase family protein [Vineibacter terrae]|uniref:Acetylornithine aminotransferase n=1 Tax=Vineibacter terrae TaxID=2586908 RepID=A0A5C8PAQ4_9HYPH|nr:aspartate aminotransferase family protein [Vineibacter terrae]TXL70628.1 aspartate aminotransferase family protein [Vineibacter terrae]